MRPRVDNIALATAAQVKYLHGLYRAVGWTDEMHKYVLANDYGVESTKDLNTVQAHEMICLLKSVIVGQDEIKVSRKQAGYIRHIWSEVDYSGGANGDVHLNAFIKKRFNRDGVEMLLKTEATKLIKMIQAMCKQAKEREGKTVVLKKLTQCVYCGEPIMWVQLQTKERVAFNVAKRLPPLTPRPPLTPPEGGELTATQEFQYVATSFHECKKG